ncbi:MAG TPA: Hsp20/alpha crystallin family protein [Myxococcota bacterium]|nr:Hsp20/alpha crystallin family protein [Myxococcota bacterium]
MARINMNRSWPTTPWASVLDEFFRSMDSGPGRPGALAQGARGVYPPVNLYETEEGYVLTAEIPGVVSEDLHVSLEGSTVTISGERKPEHEGMEGASLHRRERQVGSFRRSFELPTEIDQDNVEAVHRHGVLMLRIPRSPASKPREIPVSTS